MVVSVDNREFDEVQLTKFLEGMLCSLTDKLRLMVVREECIGVSLIAV